MKTNQFKEEGFYLIKTDLNEDIQFKIICKDLYKSLEENLNLNDISKLRGYIMGNLNIYPGIFGDKLISLLKKKKILNKVEQIAEIKLNEMEINFGGNLALSRKGAQHFHIDGSYAKEMYCLSIATEQINIENGPTEICVGSHKKFIPYWKFFFSKKKIKKLILEPGEVVLRKHNLWHRGTKNNTDKNRLLISFFIFPKNSNYQLRHFKTNEVSILGNFFSKDLKGFFQEIIYSKIKLLHFVLRFVKSFFKSR